MSTVRMAGPDPAVTAPIGGRHVQVAADDGPDKFVKFLQNNDLLQLVGTLSNIAGVLGVFSTVGGIISYFEGGQPDNAAVLDAINQLRATLQSDFLQLGDLITRQAQLTRDTVNRDAMAAALANSDTAAESIQTFLTNGDTQAFETAKSYSIAGFQFFIELHLTAPADLSFFLPGFIKAASIRLFVIASEPLSAREAQSVLNGDINSMVTLLTTMINSIQNTTDTAHVVLKKSHFQQCSVIPQVTDVSQPALGLPHRTIKVIDGYSHDERIVATDGSGNVSLTTLAFFDAQQGNPPCEQPSGLEEGSLAAAQLDRSQGVTEELTYIGVPYLEQILQSWTNLLTAMSTAPIATVLDLHGTWITGGAPGPVITVNGNSLSINMSHYKRPSAYGSVLDRSLVTAPFPDDNTYTATLQPPGTIQWSNSTFWTKV